MHLHPAFGVIPLVCYSFQLLHLRFHKLAFLLLSIQISGSFECAAKGT